MRKLLLGSIVVVVLVGVGLLVFGYQPTVYLMPTPAVMGTGEINPFDLNPNLSKSNEVRILFATNRLPAAETENRIYTIFPGDKLRVGVALMRIGEEETPWEKILNLSTSSEKGPRLAVRLEELEERAQFPLDGDASLSTAENRALADTVNRALEQSIDKDITIYVHGANTAIFRAAAQAAQYHHFTGQNSVVLAFLWPSAENLFAYGTDERHALKSAPAFARLLELLARHTNARNINIIAYSAGAQIVSPALDIVGKNTPIEKRKDLRLGEVYFAAGDIGVDTFVKHLQSYADMPRSTTVAVNLSDSVLALAARRTRVSRAGRPDVGDLNQEEYEWVREATRGPELTVIKVSAETVSGMGSRTHDFWYSHPWVSSDVPTQFIFHLPPRERGLVENVQEGGVRYWTFPPDYPKRIVEIVRKAAMEKRNLPARVIR